MPDSHTSALHDAFDSGERAAAKPSSSDRDDWITWTLKMSPAQADRWDDQVKKLAAATGRRVRRGGPSTDNAITRKDMVEALVELAEEKEAVWNLLVDKIRSS
ncbi:hypothetical protein ACIBJI_41955 [Nocardia sp. NPDC050408]|uniref:hypothetical protein n=1 Tax=Nocardia sp. NPDC050408 TaxID=3364319 RepID=UPI003796A5DE